ncbi:hypothetical protein HY375_01930 [Candidatus Berkelbacteria bacterium]|nr:hypothetical protein [Candidatus Berkelbacteria bacterium]
MEEIEHASDEQVAAKMKLGATRRREGEPMVYKVPLEWLAHRAPHMKQAQVWQSPEGELKLRGDHHQRGTITPLTVDSIEHALGLLRQMT